MKTKGISEQFVVRRSPARAMRPARHCALLLPNHFRIMNSVFLLLLLPAVAMAHGCPKFNSSDTVTRNAILGIEINKFPQEIKHIMMEYDDDVVLTGIFDCHVSDGTNEVGVTAICDPDGKCSCTALCNFNPCQSCELSCGDGPLTIRSFAADCSNVEGGLTDNCMATCGYESTGCMNATVVEVELAALDAKLEPKETGSPIQAPVQAPTGDVAPTNAAPVQQPTSTMDPPTSSAARLGLFFVAVIGMASIWN